MNETSGKEMPERVWVSLYTIARFGLDDMNSSRPRSDVEYIHADRYDELRRLAEDAADNPARFMDALRAHLKETENG